MRLAGARLSMMAGRVGRFIRDGAFRGPRSCADCVKQVVSCVVVSGAEVAVDAFEHGLPTEMTRHRQSPLVAAMCLM